MAKHKVLSSDKDIEKALAEAASIAEESIVSEVHLENRNDGPAIIIKMSDGSVHEIPKSKLEGLANATDEVASNFEITEDGLGLRWPDIDLDMFVPALLQGIYGTKAWMSSLGRLGGRARSEAKRAAARLNGLKGGRPRKQPGNCDLEASAPSKAYRSHVRRKHTHRSPLRDSSHRPLWPFNRSDYAALFGLDASATARQLPRIA